MSRVVTRSVDKREARAIARSTAPVPAARSTTRSTAVKRRFVHDAAPDKAAAKKPRVVMPLVDMPLVDVMMPLVDVVHPPFDGFVPMEHVVPVEPAVPVEHTVPVEPVVLVEPVQHALSPKQQEQLELFGGFDEADGDDGVDGGGVDVGGVDVGGVDGVDVGGVEDDDDEKSVIDLTREVSDVINLVSDSESESESSSGSRSTEATWSDTESEY